MLCPRCGNKIHTNSVICSYCQYELDADDIIDVEVEEENKKRKSNKTSLGKNKETKNAQPCSKSTNYFLLFIVYIIIFLPIVSILASFVAFGINIYSIAPLIIGILIEVIIIYFIKTLKRGS